MEKPIDFLYASLCNVGYVMRESGFVLDYYKHEYAEAKKRLQIEKGENVIICYENILLNMLENGDSLYIVDEEDMEHARTPINLEKLNKLFDEKSFSDSTFLNLIITFKTEQDDAVTAWDFIQYVAFNEIIYG